MPDQVLELPVVRPTLAEAIAQLRAMPAWEEGFRRRVADDGLPGFEEFIAHWHPSSYVVEGKQLRAWLVCVDVVLESLSSPDGGYYVSPAIAELARSLTKAPTE